jgi:RimJ/RimL family protein N-acetyltransferase
MPGNAASIRVAQKVGMAFERALCGSGIDLRHLDRGGWV